MSKSTAVTTTGKAKDPLAEFLVKKQGALARILPKMISADKFVRVALIAINRTPALSKCSMASVYDALLKCAQIGLEPDNHYAHLVPFGNDCTLVVDYKGYIKKGVEANPNIVKWAPYVVYENDEFSWENGELHHKIDYKKPMAARGKPVAFYSLIKFKDGSMDAEIMHFEETEAIKAKSRGAKSSFSPWNGSESDQIEMRKKCAIRRHAKRVPMGAALKLLNEADADTTLQDKPEKVLEVGELDDMVAVTPPEHKAPEDQTQETGHKPEDENQAAAAEGADTEPEKHAPPAAEERTRKTMPKQDRMF